MKKPRMYDVTISRPFALLRTAPQKMPSTIAIGVPIRHASTIPGMPTIPQSQIITNPICPAIAPRTIPKFRPIPAMMGINSDNIRKELRPILVMSS